MDVQVARGFIEFYGAGKTIILYESSIVRRRNCIFFLIRDGLNKKLVILHSSSVKVPEGFVSEEEGCFPYGRGKISYAVCPCNNRNASQLRKIFPYIRPQPIGLKPAIGLGDRLGLATPGHIRAVKGFKVFPVLAQQSIREMERTRRSPQEVLDDVSWAVFQEGYRGGFAADADHLKKESDIDAAFAAGFTMYTIDCSDYIDFEADKYDFNILKLKFMDLPWDEMECDRNRFIRLYKRKRIVLHMPNGELRELRFSEEDLFRAAVKFSHAIIFATGMYRRLRRLFGCGRFDFEVSIDETEEPTTPLEHLFLISEFKRFRVKIHGLALRFTGRFEKAIDYIGDLREFEDSLIEHVSISRRFGPYKISVHSGSDKFSIYPILNKLASSMLHLKTSGTSYLESLRIVARHDPNLFREMVKFCLEHFQEDRKSYYVSVDPSLIPSPDNVPDEELEKAFLDNPSGRQVLHVTYGSVLTAGDGGWLFRDRIKRVLLDNEEEFYETVAAHIKKHIGACFIQSAASLGRG